VLGLAGRWVFVAGATGRVGSVLVAALGALGANVVVHTGRSGADAAQLAKQIAAEHGVEAVPVVADVTSGTDLAGILDELRAAGIESLDVLVNCVTGSGGGAPAVADLDPQEFRRVVDVDLAGSFLLVQTLLPLLAGSARPRVLLLSSMAGVRGRPGAAHLCAAKAGVAGLAGALARDLSAAGIAVNCLAPGPVFAPGAAPPHGALGPGVGINSPADIANTIVSFVSDLNGQVNGQLLVVNGGQP
jgi:gluconate 5-dehydrogenase/3-oxoacyl-[acyl-carrier protein] reductase